jgi:hypothetical protein
MMSVWCATVVTVLGLLMSACVPEERPGEAAGELTVRSAPSSAPEKPQARVAKTLSRGTDRGRQRELEGPFADDFERESLGANYRRTSRAWQLEGGELCAREARNHPVWLKFSLPTNVRVEFDATSHSPDGDIKFELFGDGHSFAQKASYTGASGYVLIFGGWKNTLHVLARHDEHGADRLELATKSGADRSVQRPVVLGQRYHFRVERADGKTVRWWVDDEQLQVFADSAPLVGPGHEYFGFNDWAARVCFDNLSIKPLKDA